MIKYFGGMLHVEDLNPHIQTQWKMTRIELFIMGVRCILAAFKR